LHTSHCLSVNILRNPEEWSGSDNGIHEVWTMTFTLPAALRNTRPVSVFGLVIVIYFSFSLLQNLMIKKYVATIR
jgi:hypothetical protein